MTKTAVGSGIESTPTIPTRPDLKVVSDPPEGLHSEKLDLDGVIAFVKAELRSEMDAYVADAERRLAQAREIERSIETGERRTVHTEDLNVGFVMIDGYTLTANSPSGGSIAWSSLHVVLLGIDYTITDGNTANKYVYFIKPGSGTTATLQSSNTLPVLGSGDALIFINNAGTPVSVLESSIVYAVGPGAIGSAQLDPGLTTTLNNLAAADVALQATIDGAITSYYQANAPWPTGSPSPAGGNVNQGDIWYDSDNGWTYRWTGTGGSPANTWFRIADTDVALIQAQVNTKVTTYLAANASPPTAPAGGFTTGDLWMVTDQGNKLRRWSGSAWVDVLIGSAAIASVTGGQVTGTIAGTQIGTGINGSNVTTGSVPGANVGPGVAGAALGSATGQVVGSQIATNAVTPSKINAAFHILY